MTPRRSRISCSVTRSREIEAAQPAHTLSGLADEGHGALTGAAGHGHTEAVRLMLDLGFPPGARSGQDNGATAMHLAAVGSTGTVRLLLDRGADIEARDITWDSTPLEWAIVGSGMRLGHDPHPDWPAAVATLLDAAAYAIAVIATPAGISGPVLLLPLQVSVLGTPNPGGHPGQSALQRCHPWRPVPVPAARSGHRAPGRPARRRDPARRDRWICHPRRPAARPALFDLFVAAVLLPLGGWITATRPLPTASTGSRAHPAPGRALIVLGCVVGCSGGIYGVGGGSILAPILIGTGRPAAEVAPAALASTLMTSVAGVATFTILSLSQHGAVAPDRPTGIALGLGGLGVLTPEPASSPACPMPSVLGQSWLIPRHRRPAAVG